MRTEIFLKMGLDRKSLICPSGANSNSVKGYDAREQREHPL
jgi:hypothetical protein